MKGKSCIFRPFDAHRQQASRFMRAGTGQSWFAAVIWRFSGTFNQVLATCLALNIFALAPSLFIMFVYDNIISPSDAYALPALAAGVGLALMAEHALRETRSEGLAWLTARLDNIIGSQIFAHLIGLPPKLIEQASVAAQVARIKTFESVRDFFSSAVFLSFLEIPFVIVALAAMTAVAGKLVLVPLGVMAAYIVLFFMMRMKIKVAIRLAAKASSARQQFSIETFEKLRALRLNGLGNIWGKKFSDLAGREALMNFHLGFLGSIAETLAHTLTILAAVLTVGFGAQMVWSGSISTGALVASMILVWRVLTPFYSLCTMIPRLEQLRNSIIQVNSLMEIETEAETGAASASLAALRGNVTAEGVSLRYAESGDPVIKNLSFDLRPGMTAAVTGRNGSGKTSVLKLIKGLYRPDLGTVRIDGFDIRQLEAAGLRRQIAYAPQEPDFFPGSLLQNLLIGNPLATAAADDDIRNLPEGLSTSWNPDKIPSSLAARLSLARAYLQNAPLLLIDEMPNALMNGRAGTNLKEYIRQSRGRRTIVLVTHRHDLMQEADIIISLARGEDAVTGKRDPMLKILREAA